MELKKGYVLKQKDFKGDVKSLGVYDIKENYVSYKLLIDGKRYLVTREGKCDYKKCNSACCKIFAERNHTYSDGEEGYNYLKGFSDKKIGNHIIFCKNCKSLDKKGACSRWNKKDFPGPCKEFPHPFDGVYVAVLQKCSFKFVIDEVIQ